MLTVDGLKNYYSLPTFHDMRCGGRVQKNNKGSEFRRVKRQSFIRTGV
jgi:hypothetical protein